MSPKFIFLSVGCLGFALGALSTLAPQRSIGLYQRIMKGFNWNVAPIDEPREVRNTRALGVFLTLLSLAIFAAALLKF
jgi:hypothetical protein